MYVWLELFFGNMVLAHGTEGVDLFFLHWSNGKARYFDVRVGHKCRARGVGEGRLGV